MPTDLVGRTVALRRALDENADRLKPAAAALGIPPATVAALHGNFAPPDLKTTKNHRSPAAP